jgi:hypothetical protein
VSLQDALLQVRIPVKLNGDSGKTGQNVHVQSESVFTMNRNQCSRSSGMGVQIVGICTLGVDQHHIYFSGFISRFRQEEIEKKPTTPLLKLFQFLIDQVFTGFAFIQLR